MGSLGRSARWTVGALLLVLILLVSVPGGAFSHVASAEPVTVTPQAGSGGGISGIVTWNGANIASASSMSSAFLTTFATTVDVHYNWSSTGGVLGSLGPAYKISTARLQMFYLGFALGTRDVVDTNPVFATSGSFDMAWDPGVLRWILAGTYSITASLIASNGTTEWTQKFFVHVTAPLGIGAAFPILLILIGLWELYSLAVSGRQAVLKSRRSAMGKGPTEWTPPAETPKSGSSSGSSAPPKEGT